MPSRLCDACQKPYYRRNLTEVWDEQAPGSRVGWHKTQGRVCVRCMNATQARRLLMVAHVRIGAAPARQRRRAS
jgi:hypothetical protein